MELPITIICLSLLALLGVTTGQRPVPGTFGAGEISFIIHQHPNFFNPDGTLRQGTREELIAHISRQHGRLGSHNTHRLLSYLQANFNPDGTLRQDPTEEPTTVLPDTCIPSNNGAKEFEAHIALVTDSANPVNNVFQDYLQKVTQNLQEAIRSDKLDPLAVGGLEFHSENIEVKIGPGTFNGVSSEVLIGRTYGRPTNNVTLHGNLGGELMGVSGGVATQDLTKYNFGVHSTADSIKVQMNVTLNKGPCTLIVDFLNIKLGDIKVDVIGVPSKIKEIIPSIVCKFRNHLEQLLHSLSSDLKTLSNKALSNIPKSVSVKNYLDCGRPGEM